MFFYHVNNPSAANMKRAVNSQGWHSKLINSPQTGQTLVYRIIFQVGPCHSLLYYFKHGGKYAWCNSTNWLANGHVSGTLRSLLVLVLNDVESTILRYCWKYVHIIYHYSSRTPWGLGGAWKQNFVASAQTSPHDIFALCTRWCFLCTQKLHFSPLNVDGQWPPLLMVYFS